VNEVTAGDSVSKDSTTDNPTIENSRTADVGALAGRRIIITRAPEQAGELLRCLQEFGAEVLFLPMVVFLDPEDTEDLDRAIDSLGKFHWLIFTSVNATRFFLKRCRALGRWPGAGKPRIAAVGGATRAAVEAEELAVEIVPDKFNSVALAKALEAHVVDKRVLLPRSDRAGDRDELPRRLRGDGADVTEVVAYRTEEPDSLDEATRDMLLRGDVDAVTFFSPSAFDNFDRALGFEAMRQVSSHVAFAAVGPTTAAAIREAELEVAVEAADATPASLVTGLARYFASRPARQAGAKQEGTI
jgi:uroporphyrinogen III methyltransferase / synthase